MSALELEKIFGELLDRVDILRGRTEISELSGGLTNRNLKVSTPSGTYVARVSSNDSQLLEIDRQSEFENSKLAAEVAIAAPVYDYVPGGGLLVIGYLPGKTFDSSDVKNNLPRIAESCRTLHSARPFLREFNMFSVQKNYLKIVNDRGFRKPDKYDDYQKYADILSKAFAATNTGLVPCNNDLLPANIDGFDFRRIRPPKQKLMSGKCKWKL